MIDDEMDKMIKTANFSIRNVLNSESDKFIFLKNDESKTIRLSNIVDTCFCIRLLPLSNKKRTGISLYKKVYPILIEIDSMNCSMYISTTCKEPS